MWSDGSVGMQGCLQMWSPWIQKNEKVCRQNCSPKKSEPLCRSANKSQTAWLAKWRSSSTPKARFLGFRQTSNAAFVGWKAWWGCDGERSVQVRCGCGYSHSDVKARHHAELQSLLHLLCCRMFLHQSVFCSFSPLTQLFLESFNFQASAKMRNK